MREYLVCLAEEVDCRGVDGHEGIRVCDTQADEEAVERPDAGDTAVDRAGLQAATGELQDVARGDRPADLRVRGIAALQKGEEGAQIRRVGSLCVVTPRAVRSRPGKKMCDRSLGRCLRRK